MTTSIPHNVSALRAAEHLDSTCDKLSNCISSHSNPSPNTSPSTSALQYLFLQLLTAPSGPQHHPLLLCSTVVHRCGAPLWCPFSKRPLPPLYSTSSHLFPLHAPSLCYAVSPCTPPPQNCFPTSTSASDHSALTTNMVSPPINPTISGFCVTLVPKRYQVLFLSFSNRYQPGLSPSFLPSEPVHFIQ